MLSKVKMVRVRKKQSCWACGVVLYPGDIGVKFFAVGYDDFGGVLWGHSCLKCAKENNMDVSSKG